MSRTGLFARRLAAVGPSSRPCPRLPTSFCRSLATSTDVDINVSVSQPTVTPAPAVSISTPSPAAAPPKAKPLVIPPVPQLSTGPPLPAHLRSPNALVTLYSFPSLEPLRFAAYPPTHLLLPLRKDLLHRAVVHEIDCSTQGSANTKWRDEIQGSGRKIRPQKGTGRARLGDKKSPMLRGGGVAHGPKPRDFSTELPQKIYDVALRTALSYRYSRGDLVVVDGSLDVPFKLKQGARPVDPLKTELAAHLGDVATELYSRLGWVKGVHGHRTLFVTESESPSLDIALKARPKLGRTVMAADVEVRDLLKLDRVVIEKRALNQILIAHQTDLIKHAGFNRTASTDPKVIHSLYKFPPPPPSAAADQRSDSPPEPVASS